MRRTFVQLRLSRSPQHASRTRVVLRLLPSVERTRYENFLSRSEWGYVSDALIATAKKQKVDLIVMASHGRRGIKRLLLGSETQQVLTHASIPVLVLR